MYAILSMLLVGCAGSTDSVHIGHGTGELRNWDRAKCTCNAWTNELTGERKVFTAMLSCAPHRNGHRFAGLLNLGSNAADFGMGRCGSTISPYGWTTPLNGSSEPSRTCA